MPAARAPGGPESEGASPDAEGGADSQEAARPQQLAVATNSEQVRISKGFVLTWNRALTWYFLRVSSLRTHLEPWTAVDTRGRGSLAAR